MPLPPEVIWKIIAGIAAVEAALMAMLVAMVRTTARATQAGGRGGLVVAFYHPRCTGGGGGERVLWKMVQVLSEYAAGAGAGAGAGADDTDDGDDDDDGGPKKNKNGSSGVIEQVVIYTKDAPTETYARDVYRHVRERFALELPEQTLNLRFVHLDEYADYLVPSKRFSLLAEGWNTMRLAFLALQLTLRSDGLLTVPHVWIDTTGAAFTYLPARVLFGCCVLAYVHYPTISTDMLRRVWQTRRRSGDAYDTSSTSTILSLVKCVYYVFFAILYGAVGSLSSLVLTNSTWTYNHIRSLWKYAAWRDRIRIVYPPCRLLESSDNKDEDSKETIAKPREPAIVSIGQFRPEKDHALQLEAMARLLKQHPEWKHKKGCKLVLIGSCRSGEADDQARLEKLRTMAKQLGIEEYVEFVVNQPFAVVQEWLLGGSVGIHTVRRSKYIICCRWKVL